MTITHVASDVSERVDQDGGIVISESHTWTRWADPDDAGHACTLTLPALSPEQAERRRELIKRLDLGWLAIRA